MTPSRHAQVREIFLEVVSQLPTERASYLKAHYPDPELQAEVEALLAHHVDAPEPLKPIVDSACPATNTAGAFVAGQVISDRFRIIDTLGWGGAGTVYRADDLVLNQKVAMKVLSVPPSHYEAWLERFKREVRLAHKVSHPNVCRVFDFGSSDGQSYLTMEYCDGEDLAHLIRRAGRLSPEKGCEIAGQICAGLAAAHAAGILHRDLKPANILISASGRVLISDFGIAAAVETSARDIAGTPGYMSPEQIVGLEVDERSDIYSLGLVLYEIFSGRPAFQEESIASYLQRQTRDQPVSLSEIVPGIDPELESLIQQCIAKDRRHRPASTLEVAAALPGLDVLGMALRARNIASPALIANAMRLARQVSRPGMWLIGTLLTLALLPVIRAGSHFSWDAPDSLSPAVLMESARSIAAGAMPTGLQPYSAQGYCDRDQAHRIVEQLVGPLPENQAVGPSRRLLYWFRNSSMALNPNSVDSLVFASGMTTPTDPPFSGAKNLLVLLDDRARLLLLAIRDFDSASVSEPSAFATAARIEDLELDSTHLPGNHQAAGRHCQARRAKLFDSSPVLLIHCPLAESLNLTFVAEAHPSTARPTALMARFQNLMIHDSMRLLFVLATLLAIPLAMRNLRRSRCDFQGATRLFTLFFAVSMAGRVVRGTWDGPLEMQITLVAVAVLRSLGLAAMAMVLYLALEPFVRRHWPHAMITWTRLLQARPPIPAFWHHILVGIATGTLLSLLQSANFAIAFWYGDVQVEPFFTAQVGQRIAGLGSVLSGLCGSALTAMGNGLLYYCLLAAGRWIFGRVSLAMAAVALIHLVIVLPRGPEFGLIPVMISALSVSVLAWVAVHFGLLPLVLALFVADVLSRTPLSLHSDHWVFPITASVLVSCTAATLIAYGRSRSSVGSHVIAHVARIPQ